MPAEVFSFRGLTWGQPELSVDENERAPLNNRAYSMRTGLLWYNLL